MDYKHLLARIITGYTHNTDIPSYKTLCLLIERDSYRLIWKYPSKIFLLGIMGIEFTIQGEKWSFNILLLKNTLVSILEDISGIEITFRNKDWDNITPLISKFGKLDLTHSDGYMSEYFDNLI